MKDILGFDGKYGITESGDIYTIPRITVHGHRIHFKKLKTFVGTTGYTMVALVKEGKTKMVRVHRLLALTYIPIVDGKNCVNHIDGNKLNNSLDNLEWCTHSENTKHSYDVLKRCLPDGPRNAKSKLLLDLNTGVYYDSLKFAAIAKGLTRSRLKYHLLTHGQLNGLIYA